MKRQGDLLITAVTNIPAGAVVQNTRILAEGELTGHRHELDQGALYEKDGALFFHVPDGGEVILTHPEHHTLTFTPGTYKVVRQREYEPGGWHHVQD